jgi:hypothetical protein
MPLKMFLFLVLVCVCSLSIAVPGKVFAAAINCNPVPSICEGTDNADTMTATNVQLDSQNNYKAEGLKGDDVMSFDISNIFGLFVAGDEGNDRISLKTPLTGTHGASAFGDSGDDTIAISAAFGGAHGGEGSDKISIRSTVESFLFQNDDLNTPDGKKDILNCNGSPHSKAYISLEDGDTATRCEKVITTQINP